MSILAPPGSYTVRVDVGGTSLSQKLEVRKDPNSGGTEADIQQQTKTLFELRRDMDTAADLINDIELVRSQIYALLRVVDDGDIKKVGDQLDRRLIDLEQNLIELRVTGRGQDNVRWRAKLMSKLGYLANGLASADFKPTDQQGQVQKLLGEQVKSHQGNLQLLVSRDLGAFNELLRKKNVPNVIPRKAGP